MLSNAYVCTWIHFDQSFLDDVSDIFQYGYLNLKTELVVPVGFDWDLFRVLLDLA